MNFVDVDTQEHIFQCKRADGFNVRHCLLFSGVNATTSALPQDSLRNCVTSSFN